MKLLAQVVADYISQNKIKMQMLDILFFFLKAEFISSIK